MGQTIAEKILSAHSGKKVKAGDLVIANVDFAFAQDGTAPLVIGAIKGMGATRVKHPKKTAFVIDHSAPSPNVGVSTLHRLMRDFTRDRKIFLYDVGCGVCHQVIPEGGNVVCGDLTVGADSHTCTYGALNAFSTGLGSTDIAASMIAGKLWFKVPESIKIIIKGKLPRGVYAKDIILHIIGELTADGATYQSVEFSGEAISKLSMEGRFTICNMAVEMGAKAGIMAADEKTLKWLKKHSSARKPRSITADRDARYIKVLEFDISKLEPQVSRPHRVDNVTSVNRLKRTKIAVAFLGTCTNGRLEDLKIASKILKNKKVHRDVRCIVSPASRKIYLEALREGIIETFIRSGAAVMAPGCGPCVGTHEGIPADGENVISTANRNFKGRMGNPNAFIYLASPATAAASALEGRITDPRKYI
jgi:3-isopropylmalate/(R)-2-methylmalate dehydratase large subunit